MKSNLRFYLGIEKKISLSVENLLTHIIKP